MSTGITGFKTGSGLNDPQYVLSFVQIQRLVLEATKHPLRQAEVEKGLAGTPVSENDLLRLELLRRDGNNYRLNYLVLTVQDQETIYRVSTKYGRGLADAFRAHQAEFHAITAQYPDAALRPELLFDLVAGASLNWGGLDLTSELGYRIQQPKHTNGDTYFAHSAEIGADLDATGFYWDSQTFPGSKISFSTFGDGGSLPRLQGVPDVFDGVDNALESWRKTPDVYAALRSEYIAYLSVAIDDAGEVMNAVAHGALTDDALTKLLTLPAPRQKATLELLVATGYLRKSERGYAVGVPVLMARDKPMVDAVVKLSRSIMNEWLQKNYTGMKAELQDLSPMRNGLPFALAFSEVWHYTFGSASKSLAETGFYANPRQQGNRYEGYVPLVWESSLLALPGASR